jgi:hypothetical protein
MYYKQMIEKYYSAELLDSFYAETNEAYSKAIVEKEKYLPIWNKFVVEIKNLKSVKGTRDTYYSSYPDTGKITIGIDKNCEEGVTFNLNFRTMQMGIYYCHYKEISKIPIMGQSIQLPDFVYVRTDNHLSYYPFNNAQEKFTFLLIELADTFFPNFKLFNNVFAAKKAQNVIIDMGIIKELDYFQVFFGPSMDGIS